MTKKSGFRNRSVSALLQDAADLRVLCEKDKEQLIAAGLNWSYYDKLQEKAELLQKLHSNVMLYLEDRKYEMALKKTLRQMCIVLRTDMKKNLVNIVKIKDINKRIPSMSRNRTNAGISQDLLDLAICAENMLIKYPDCCIKMEWIEKLRTCSSKLLKMSSVPKGPSSDPQLYFQHQLVRNELQVIIQLIRRYGKLAFYNNPRHIKAYYCH